MMLQKGELYCGYITEESIRKMAASGGIVSGILIYLLKNKQIDCALVSRLGNEKGKFSAISEWAETPGEILNAQGSTYAYTPVLKELLADHKRKRIAVVALPCQVRQIRKWMEKSPDLKSRIKILIGLFCRGAPMSSLYSQYLLNNGIDPDSISSVKVSRKYIGGTVSFHMNNGNIHHENFLYLNSLRVLGVKSFSGCFHCTEHLSEQADIAVGDIYNQEYNKRPIKHSSIIINNETGRKIIQSMINDKIINHEFFGINKYKNEFKKIERFTRRIKERKYAARIMRLSFPVKEKKEKGFYPFHLFAWILYLTFSRISKKRHNKIIYLIPKPIIKICAILFKIASKS